MHKASRSGMGVIQERIFMKLPDLLKKKDAGSSKGAAQANRLKSDVMPVLVFCTVTGMAGFIALMFCGHTAASRVTAVMWMLACFLSGNMTGFLFAIPKNSAPAQQNATAAAGGQQPAAGNAMPYTPLINNNLIEISDWLTKIIVGLGLVQLREIPGFMYSLATNLAMGFDPPNKATDDLMARAYALIVGYFILGFLFAYLVMRLYLSGEMIKADQKNYSGLQDQVIEIKAKMENLQSAQSVLGQKVAQQPANLPGAVDKEAALQQLKAMADEYTGVRIADYSARVQKKQELTAAMANYAADQQITKDDIIAYNKTYHSDGLLIALAMLVTLKPESGDVDRLLRFGVQIRLKHVRYVTLNAIAKLMESKLVAAPQINALKNLIAAYRINADPSLLTKCDEVNSLLNSYQQ
ncbi:hypothetical protein [Mucilaginibacter sp. L3T2-6]|uniref:hypothetical protein n=1 Tax=Mucilaginibacter sp. L3T2-6 TaxID=3062491 RepID=UPI0026745518|nr:hypothetical protein [Mucilaginibacter sp. L3T2-6]MDO3644936.1 hypothetical protein [Mucilaginibacter sp. L3T2-6]MDV6217438.1 hypothetical protein [Mucilaginibacter sp. L3T2-6]